MLLSRGRAIKSRERSIDLSTSTPPALDRRPCAAIEARFAVAKNSHTDINEHVELLRELALQCEHITEFGMRGANASTVAFLAACPRMFISWDIDPRSIISQAVADLVAEVEGSRCTFQPRVGNTLTISPIEQTDLLFIDTLHNGQHLLDELKRHADPVTNNVRRYLIFHDTAHTTFGDVGEDGGTGLREAIRWFQKNWAFPVWELVEDRQNNNGLVVLKNLRAPDYGLKLP